MICLHKKLVRVGDLNSKVYECNFCYTEFLITKYSLKPMYNGDYT